MTPTIIEKAEHQINKDLIDPDALFVLERLRKKGFIAYLVGGAVRDLLLQHLPKDFDISTSAKPEEIKRIFSNCILIGKRFCLAHVRFGRKVIEVATFRRGDIEDESLITHDNEWGDEVGDVIRRDFTINGLFYDDEKEIIIDYVGGFEDAKKNLLRVIGKPYVRFRQDPVRMIRLLKFRARFGLEIQPEATDALLECRSEILKSSQARVLEELIRMLELGSSHNFFKLLSEYGMIEILLPKLSQFLEHSLDSEVYSFLQEIDRILKVGELQHIPRPLLIAAVAFPPFHTHLHHLNDGRVKPMHLGEIFLEANFIMQNLFLPFFQLPRKLASDVIGILTAQFRFTPMHKKKHVKYVIPRSPEFHLALDFFKLRTQIEPGLQKLYEEWHFFWRKQQKELPAPTGEEVAPRARRSRGRRR